MDRNRQVGFSGRRVRAIKPHPCCLQALLGARGGGRAPAFEEHEGVGCSTGALDGPVELVAALVAVGGPAAPAGQAIARTKVATMVVSSGCTG